MWPDDRQCFRIQVRHVNCIADGAFEQRRTYSLRNLDTDALLRLNSRGAEVRSKH